SGALRPIRGVLPMALGVRRDGLRRLIVPEASGEEAAIGEGTYAVAVGDREAVGAMLRGEWDPEPVRAVPWVADAEAELDEGLDLTDVRGQDDAKRALEIAAAGGHNVRMIGPPGSGKTMLARRVPGILPPPLLEE